ncbi:MAG: FprA family A-type flavoprotein [Dysgonamonadaceae bacterium]|jgi:flavorubredoxin|nr:FprA family A-type flavoprotein [Dysgonamonadaceae bacterium]
MKLIGKGIYYVGVNDRQKLLFENLWPLSQGVSYNSYIIKGSKNILVDTVDICYSEQFFGNIGRILDGATLDFLIINHMEPDHSGSIAILREKYPNIKIIGNKLTFGMLAGYYGITDGLMEVKDGETLEIGDRRLRFYTAPMVHWPEVMFTYDETTKTLFSADAFGTFGALDGGVIDKDVNPDRYWDEMRRYYSNIVGKYGNPVQKALQKLANVEIDAICPTHGPVWTSCKAQAIEIYDRMSRYDADPGATIVYGSMYGHTERMAETIAEGLSDAGIRDIVIHNVSRSHASYILRDIFKYQAVIIGSPTYSNTIFPEIESLLSRIELREIKNRLFGYFGCFTWAGQAVKRLAAFAEAVKWETVGAPVEQKQNISTEDECLALGRAIAERLNN